MREKRETLHFQAGPLYFLFCVRFQKDTFPFRKEDQQGLLIFRKVFCSKIEVRKKETFFGRGMFWNAVTSASLRLGLEIF